MSSKPTILIIEDDPDNMMSVKDVAEDAGFETLCAATGIKGVEIFRASLPDIVLSDLVLPDIDGFEVLRRVKNFKSSIPLIIMTAYSSVESGVRAMREGAYDYVTKPLDIDDIQSKLRRAYETSLLRKKVDTLSRTIKKRYATSSIIAESKGMKSVLTKIEALADTAATVLVRGESGTGKELVARALHVDSVRADGPFVAVNCGAFAENLLESELFGHERGSFTGAVNTHKGAFERADGGTLFLDEIGDDPLAVQVQLLRALELKGVRRVGGKETVNVDVRLDSATNKELEEMVEEGTFREDLLYRLNVVSLEIPPLRERVADIRLMADRFIAAASVDNNIQVNSVKPDFYEVLEAYNWPGNVRQLKNVVESAVLLSPGGVLSAESMNLPRTSARHRASEPDVPETDGLRFPKEMTLNQIERIILEERLKTNNGNRTLSAEQLGISRRTIQRKIKEHELPY
ncbi:MAG: sigma-54 dependent transcriptional regulator [Kiritimatiellae bacterium]|nr:sigma-54 dependent transcriptional regulator [Kiritimatiellia bacterium]